MTRGFLITRPRNMAQSTEQALHAILPNAQIYHESMMDIVALSPKTDDLKAHYNGMVITSQAAISHLKAKDFPDIDHVFCVGDQTRDVAITQGWSQAQSAQGDKKDLLKLITDTLPPKLNLNEEQVAHKPSLLFLTRLSMGAQIELSADVMEDTLYAYGYDSQRIETYAMAPQKVFSNSFLENINQGFITDILFLSKGVVDIFKTLLRQNPEINSEILTGIKAWCLSANIAKACEGLSFQSCYWPDKPQQSDLIELIQKMK